MSNWDVEQYESRYSFVWQFGADLMELLAPKPGERVVDLGCGSGQLTDRIAQSGAAVIGIDNAPTMIAQARINYPHLEFRLADATRFTVEPPADAVFSNAALHWVKDAAAAAACIRGALKPGGRFVAELGGQGNVQSVLDALEAVLGHCENPWYYPSIGEYATLLENHGLSVTQAWLFDRPTPLEGEGAMEDWLTMFGGSFFSGYPEARQTELRRQVAGHLRPRFHRNGTWMVDYRRLRIVALAR